MAKNGLLIVMAFAVIFPLFCALPAYAEVASLQSDQSFYTLGSKIRFSGTVGISDYQKLVNLVIHDPFGKFVLISGNYSDSTYAFEITVYANNTDQFYTKGTYSVTAFIGEQSQGKTVNFDFSPDGSPVIHENPSTNPIVTSNGQTTSQHYTAKLNENIGIHEVTANMTGTTSISAVKSSMSFDLKNLLYPIISLCGVGIVVVILYDRKRRSEAKQKVEPKDQSTEVTFESKDDYAIMILKNRLAKGEITLDEFKILKDTLAEP